MIGWLGALLVSAVCLILAFVAFTVGVNRWHSTNLEGWAVDRLSANFSSLKADCFTNMEIPDVGRLDFAVETAKGLAVVQVEPWSCWKPDGEAEAAAAEEAARLAEYLTPTFMVIWLPRGRPSLRQRFLKPRAGGVPVIFGGERMVVRPILKLNKVNIRESIPRLRR